MENRIQVGINGKMHNVVLTEGVHGNMLYHVNGSSSSETIALTLDSTPPVTLPSEHSAVWLDYFGKNKLLIDSLIRAGYLTATHQEKHVGSTKVKGYVVTDKWFQRELAVV